MTPGPASSRAATPVERTRRSGVAQIIAQLIGAGATVTAHARALQLRSGRTC